MSIQFSPIGPLWLEFLVFLALVASGAYAIWGTRYQNLSRRVIIIALRLLILLSAWAMLHKPMWVHRVTRNPPKQMALIVDRSGSMTAPMPNGQTRLHAARQAARPLLEQNPKANYYELDKELHSPGSPDGSSQPGELGHRTDFFAGLSQLFRQAQDHSAVLMLSDGHDLGRLAHMDLSQLKNWLERMDAPPINTVLVGKASSGPDLAIHSIEAPSFAYVRSPVQFRVTVMARDLEPHSVQVQLLENQGVVQVREIQLDTQGFGHADFEFHPESTGEHLYTVAVPTHPKERDPHNNQQQHLLAVGRDKISVLHISGSVNWDLQGIRQMLESDPLVDLTAFYIMRTRDHLQRGVDGRHIPPDEMALVPFPTEEIFDRQLFGFDVVLFQDFDAGNYFSDSYQARRLLDKMRLFVEQHRGGLVVVGGPRMAAGPSLAISPLAQILPIQPPVYRTPTLAGPIQGQILKGAEHHPLVQYFQPETQEFTDVMDGVSLHQSAQVWIQSENQLPLLATLEPGNGRVVFINCPATHRWLQEAVKHGHTGEAYHQFWHKLLAWTTADPSLQPVRISAVKSAERPLELDVDILLRQSDYQPAAQTRTRLQIRDLSQGQEPQTQEFNTFSDGRAQLKWKAPAAGYYAIQPADEPWKSLARPTIVFLGGSQSEFQNQDPVTEHLERLAALSGGRFFQSLDDLDRSALKERTGFRKPVVETKRLTLWNWLWTLPILVSMVGLEWYLRRSGHLA